MQYVIHKWNLGITRKISARIKLAKKCMILKIFLNKDLRKRCTGTLACYSTWHWYRCQGLTYIGALAPYFMTYRLGHSLYQEIDFNKLVVS